MRFFRESVPDRFLNRNVKKEHAPTAGCLLAFQPALLSRIC